MANRYCKDASVPVNLSASVWTPNADGSGGDIAYADLETGSTLFVNGHTVTIDVDITAKSFTLSNAATDAAGQQWVITATRTIYCSLLGVNTSIKLISWGTTAITLTLGDSAHPELYTFTNPGSAASLIDSTTSGSSRTINWYGSWTSGAVSLANLASSVTSNFYGGTYTSGGTSAYFNGYSSWNPEIVHSGTIVCGTGYSFPFKGILKLDQASPGLVTVTFKNASGTAVPYSQTAATQAADAATITAATLDVDGTDTDVALGASTATIQSAECWAAAQADIISQLTLAADVASAVRAELATELGRIDAAITTRSTLTQTQVTGGAYDMTNASCLLNLAADQEVNVTKWGGFAVGTNMLEEVP